MTDMVERTLFAFDTENVVRVDAAHADALDDVAALCVRCEHLFSSTLPGSELSRINDAQGRRIEVEPDMARLLAASLEYCEATEGLFDITMGGVVRLWDFKRGIVPDGSRVREALTHVDYRGVAVDGCSVQIEDPQARLALGGIAKGFIADRICEVLAADGVEHAIVNLGGNVAVMGGKPDGRLWRVGISKPVASWSSAERPAAAAVDVRTGSVVTSGIYERAFRREGRLFHHILDPKTCFPAQTDLLSATVISRTALDGDGFTTALVIMGLQRAQAFVEARDNLEAVFVTDRGTIEVTSGIGTRIPFAKAADPCSL